MVNYIKTNVDGSRITAAGAESSIVENPTLEASVSTGELVYYDEPNSKWDEFEFPSVTLMGLGIVDGNSNIVTKGLATGLSGLTAGSFYYAESGVAGSISTTVSDIKIGFAKSTTELIVDIDIEGSGKSSDFKLIVTYGYGYFGGGYTTAETDKMNRLTFSNSNVFANSSVLSLARELAGCCGSVDGFGYYCGGGGSGGTKFADVDRITFSNSNVNAATSDLTQNIYSLSGLGDADVLGNGYIGGGRTGGNEGLPSVDIITFSNSNISAAASELTVGRRLLASFGDTSIYGYWGGGYSDVSSQSNKVDRLTFSSSNISANSSNLTQLIVLPSGFGDSGVQGFGYFMGGQISGNNEVNNVDRLTFSNSQIFANGSSMTIEKGHSGSFGDAVAYGYCGGGFSEPGNSNTDNVQQVTFSNSQIFTNGSGLVNATIYCTGVSQEY